jgi:hypothetical protein
LDHKAGDTTRAPTRAFDSLGRPASNCRADDNRFPVKRATPAWKDLVNTDRAGVGGASTLPQSKQGGRRGIERQCSIASSRMRYQGRDRPASATTAHTFESGALGCAPTRPIQSDHARVRAVRGRHSQKSARTALPCLWKSAGRSREPRLAILVRALAQRFGRGNQFMSDPRRARPVSTLLRMSSTAEGARFSRDDGGGLQAGTRRFEGIANRTRRPLDSAHT